MEVKFDRLNDVNGRISVAIVEADYADKVKKQLKDIAKNHTEPGFRPGHTPAGLIQKKYGTAVKYDIVNKVVSDALFDYVKENKLPVLGNPVPERNDNFDINNTEFTFVFNVGLAPDFDTHVDKDLHVPYYTIEVTEEMIDNQSNGLRRRMGEQVKGDEVEPDALVKGEIVELDAEGKPLENGIRQTNGILAPKYFKSEEQRKLFEGKKVGDTIVFNPAETCESNPTELSSMLNIDKNDVDNHKGDFSMEIKEIIVLRPAELNQEYFDQVFGKDQVHNEEEYRAALKEMIANQLRADSNYRFTIDAKEAIMKAVGSIDLPDEILKDYLKMQNEALTDETVDKEYEEARPQLEWQIIRDRIAEKLQIKLEEEDIRNVARLMARNQFAQYGMTSAPEDAVERLAGEILKDKKSHDRLVDQAFDMKLYEGIHGAVTLDDKTVSVEEFNALFTAPEEN